MYILKKIPPRMSVMQYFEKTRDELEDAKENKFDTWQKRSSTKLLLYDPVWAVFEVYII
jgi:hypothetical protein